MELLRFNDFFTDEDVSNYDLFIQKLKQLKESGYTTKEIIGLVYQYYKKYVTYNYDQLQIVKMNNIHMYPEFVDIFKKYPNRPSTAEDTQQIKQGIINELNEIFIRLEGRPLTQRTIDKAFEGFGKIIHHEESNFEQFGVMKHKDAYDEIKGFDIGYISGFSPIYENGMLQDGICGEYVNFFRKICKDLDVKHFSVGGKGTTSHGWSLVYLQEEQRWVHFDMTMVKFYQDGWIKEHMPYTEQDWIAATTENIFKMQPTREIYSIDGKTCIFNKNNYEELDLREFDDTVSISKIEQKTKDVLFSQKEKARTIVNQDVIVYKSGKTKARE